MRSTLFWLVVLSILYLDPDFLRYAYWRSFFHPGPVAAAQPLPAEPPPASKPSPLDPSSVRAEKEEAALPAGKPKAEPQTRIRRQRGFPAVGDSIDGFQGVAVYYNGSTRNVLGRHTAPDGYNLGLKYQCVEFVKRYYYQHLQHRMPNAWGHARDFFQASLEDGALNRDRNLFQYANPSRSRPQVNDILVFRGRSPRGFGHVAIVTRVSEERVYIIQQNAGSPRNARTSYRLRRQGGRWKVAHPRILGWLRKEVAIAP